MRTSITQTEKPREKLIRNPSEIVEFWNNLKLTEAGRDKSIKEEAGWDPKRASGYLDSHNGSVASFSWEDLIASQGLTKVSWLMVTKVPPGGEANGVLGI